MEKITDKDGEWETKQLKHCKVRILTKPSAEYKYPVPDPEPTEEERFETQYPIMAQKLRDAGVI